MNDNVTKQPLFTVALLGRMSYDPETQQLRLNPRTNILTSFDTNFPVQAYEAYTHLIEIANLVNGEIEEAIDLANEAADEEAVVEIGEEDPTVVDYAKFFKHEENPCFDGMAIHPEGYSNLSVYITIRSTINSPTYSSPDDFDSFMNVVRQHQNMAIIHGTVDEVSAE